MRRRGDAGSNVSYDDEEDVEDVDLNPPGFTLPPSSAVQRAAY